MIPKHVSGKSLRRIRNRERTKKRFFKGGYMVIDELRSIDPETWERLKEARAVMAGLPPADELVGRHVHKGRIVAKQTCCSENGSAKP